MGHGTVAPIGAALAGGGRPVVAIIGDACFTMNGMELITAAEYGIPSRLDRREQQHARHHVARRAARRLRVRSPPFATRRRSRSRRSRARWGSPRGSSTARDRCRPRVREALDTPGPSLIEVRVDAQRRAAARRSREVDRRVRGAMSDERKQDQSRLASGPRSSRLAPSRHGRAQALRLRRRARSRARTIASGTSSPRRSSASSRAKRARARSRLRSDFLPGLGGATRRPTQRCLRLIVVAPRRRAR